MQEQCILANKPSDFKILKHFLRPLNELKKTYNKLSYIIKYQEIIISQMRKGDQYLKFISTK